MKRLVSTLVLVVVSGAVGAAVVRSAPAQAEPLQVRTDVDQRLGALEKRVRLLEDDNARLRSVIQIAADKSSVTINPNLRVDIKSAAVNIESSAGGTVKAGGTLTVKGALVAIN